MNRRLGISRILVTVLLVLSIHVISAPPAVAQLGPGPFNSFPTADTTDGRMLSFGCEGLATFEQRVELVVAAPAVAPEFTVSLFDGDTGMPDGSGSPHWDSGTRQLLYSLYVDPMKEGVADPANLVGSWTGNDPNPTSGGAPGREWTASAANMPDNDWWGVTVQTSAQAQAPSGNYFYLLTIETDSACGPGELLASDLKIAGSAPLTFLVPRFGFEASMRPIPTTGPIIYSPFNPIDILNSSTTYDGSFVFFLQIDETTTELALFDGDFDFGTDPAFPNGVPSGTPLVSCDDDDDLNTTAGYTSFPFTPLGATPEGSQPQGSPADDSPGDIFRRGEPGSPGRVGCVRYDVIDPLGNVYSNPNPSSSQEWERYNIVSQLHPAAGDPLQADVTAPMDFLPTGIWRVDITGLDLSNLNFWYFMSGVCADQEGQPACPGPVYFLGDTVWLDGDGDGAQSAGEGGISGVTVNLYREGTPYPIKQAVTGDLSDPDAHACRSFNTGLDEDGFYCFGLDEPGTYRVEIAPESFLPGGPLEGLLSTTGGEDQTDMVTDDNVLTYDFGYRMELDPVRPILECVADNGDGTYAAYFGYKNENPFPVTIPVGGDNKFSPAPADRGQPTTFEPGRTSYWPDAAFSVVWGGGNLVWSLDGRTSTASPSSTPCSYHLFFDKQWVDRDGNFSSDPPSGLPADYEIVATSSLGTATCSYPTGSDELSCVYDNQQPPALDDNGLWVPVGETYTVVENNLPSGYAPEDGVGIFSPVNSYCIPGRDGIEKYCDHEVVNAEQRVYCVDEAELDPVYGPSTGGHGVWLPGIHEDLVFSDGPGQFTENNDGTATLTGTVWSDDHSDRGFELDVLLTGYTDIAPPGSPKKELQSSAYVDNGGPVDPSDWWYYTDYTGTLTGVGDYAGAVIEIVKVGPAFQVGEGASGKNIELGASSWFTWTVVQQPSGHYLKTTGQGDFNVDLFDCACPPELDFDRDGNGEWLGAGTKIKDQWANHGIHFSTNDPWHHPLMLFDSAHPTGGDPDLGAPNEDFGGPGIGNGGEYGTPGENSEAQGRVLIISEDGHTWDPDDNNDGGTIIVTFDFPVAIDAVKLLDIDRSGSSIIAYDATGGLLASVPVPNLGDNSYQEVPVGATGVSRLEIYFRDSGAVAGIVFCPCEGSSCDGGGGGPVAIVESESVRFRGSVLQWDLVNRGDAPALLSGMQADWPEVNGKLKKVRIGSEVVWNEGAPRGLAAIGSGWLGGPSTRLIPPGGRVRVKLVFAETAQPRPESYYLEAQFDGGATAVHGSSTSEAGDGGSGGRN